MSYDLMVFDPRAAPRDRPGFMAWYGAQTQWTEPHDYSDPAVTTPALAAFYADLRREFPNMNGPDASEDYDNPRLADYSIGRSIIYVTFAWSQAENAYEAVRRVAAGHNVGFFDVSAEEGEILFPPSAVGEGPG